MVTSTSFKGSSQAETDDLAVELSDVVVIRDDFRNAVLIDDRLDLIRHFVVYGEIQEIAGVVQFETSPVPPCRYKAKGKGFSDR